METVGNHESGDQGFQHAHEVVSLDQQPKSDEVEDQESLGLHGAKAKLASMTTEVLPYFAGAGITEGLTEGNKIKLIAGTAGLVSSSSLRLLKNLGLFNG